MRTTVFFFLGQFFICTNSFATEPSAIPKPKEFRLSVESLRFRINDDAGVVADKLRKNFSRDCDSYEYQREDFDLRVSAVFESFPVAAIEDYLQRHPVQCPPSVNAAIEVIEKKGDRRRAKEAAVNYLNVFNKFESYPWNRVTWSMVPMLRRIGSPCAQKDLAAFQHIFCGYSKKNESGAGFNFFDYGASGRLS